MPQQRYFVSTAFPTTLPSGCGASDTTITVAAMPGTWPAQTPYPLLADWGTTSQEVMLVTGAPAGGGPFVLPVTRGADGTTAQVHGSGAEVVHGVSAEDINQPLAYIGASDGAGAGYWNAKLHGLACDGTTDDTAALNTLIAAAQAAGGGTIFFPSLAKISGQVVIPATVSGTSLRQPPLRFLGTVASMPGNTETGVPYPSGGLDLRYGGRTDTGCSTTLGSAIVGDPSASAGDLGYILTGPGIPDQSWILAVNPGTGYTVTKAARATASGLSLNSTAAKIQTFGLGTLELDHMLLCAQGTDSSPFVGMTATTVIAHDCAILGNNSKTSGTCDQDAFVIGGPGVGTALSSALTSGSVYTALPVQPLTNSVKAGPIIIGLGTASQQSVTSTGTVAVGGTSIPVSSFTAGANFPAWTSVFTGTADVFDASSEDVPSSQFQGYDTRIFRNYFDRVRRIQAGAATSGDITIRENAWWQACGSNLAAVPSTLTSALTGGTPVTSLPVTALSRAILAGDSVQVGTGSAALVCTASGNQSIGDTSVAVNSITPAVTIASGTVVFDVTAGIGACIQAFGNPAANQLCNLQVVGNRFETSGAYNYTTHYAGDSSQGVIAWNDQQDFNAANIAVHRFESSAGRTLVITGQWGNGAVPVMDDQNGNNAVLTSLSGNQTSLPTGLLITGNGTTGLTITHSAASGKVLTSDATGRSSWQTPANNTIGGVTVSGTPSAGQVLEASSSSAASWQSISVTETNPQAGDAGYAAWTGDPFTGGMAQIVTTSGVIAGAQASGFIALTRMNVAGSGTVNGNLSFYWLQPVGGSPANCFVGIYNSAGTLLWTSSDLTSTAKALLRLSTTVTSVTTGTLYVASLVGTQGTTSVGGLGYFSGAGALGIAAAQLSAAPYRCSFLGGSATSLPSSVTLSTFTRSQYFAWAALD